MDESVKDPPPPTATDIFQYRYQHGTNLGSIFVLERWLFNSIYDPETQGSSELEAVRRSLQVRGVEKTRSKWESHWLTALTEDDLVWLKNVARCNSIRLPIGFFTLGPTFCMGTPFEGEPSEVYLNCWNIVKHLIDKCYQYGIGVLIDFHAVPGGANDQSHSGTDTGKAELWENIHYRALARDCIAFIAQEVTYHAMAGVFGIQLCNEAIWNAPGLYEWYDEVLDITGAVNSSLPIYISDGWNLGKALDFAKARNRIPTPVGRSPVIVDTHKYYTFSDSHRSMAPEAIIDQVPEALAGLTTLQGNVYDRKSAVEAYVGEYSCTMDRQTWNRVATTKRPYLTEAFGQEQTKQWISKASGSAFWTFKMDWMNGGDWGFKEQVNTGAITAPVWLTIPQPVVRTKIQRAESQRAQLKDSALSQHEKYWDSSPLIQFKHHHYALGWDLGYSDAMTFFGATAHGVLPGAGDGGDRIGAVDLWTRRRIVESNQFRQALGWEWEQGFRKGIGDFYASVGV